MWQPKWEWKKNSSLYKICSLLNTKRFDHEASYFVPAEETGINLGQKKDSYFYSCCHNNWCWATGRKQSLPFDCSQNLEMLDQFWNCFWISLFLLCHKDLRAGRLSGGELRVLILGGDGSKTNTHTAVLPWAPSLMLCGRFKVKQGSRWTRSGWANMTVIALQCVRRLIFPSLFTSSYF